MTIMAAKDNLIKDWIQYLKNNQIVNLESDPTTGKLSYKRPVTTKDLRAFLNGTGNFDDAAVDKAINSLNTTAAPSAPAAPAAPAAPKTPEERRKEELAKATKIARDKMVPKPPPRAVNPPPSPPRQGSAQAADLKAARAAQSAKAAKSHTGGKVAGAGPSQTRNAINKRNRRSRLAGRPETNESIYAMLYVGSVLEEDIADNNIKKISEPEVETVFDMLSSPSAPSPSEEDGVETPEKQLADKEDAIRKLKRLIRDKMSDQQRISLWRALNHA